MSDERDYEEEFYLAKSLEDEVLREYNAVVSEGKLKLGARKGELSHCKFFCFRMIETLVTVPPYVCTKYNGGLTCENCGCCKTCGETHDDYI